MNRYVNAARCAPIFCFVSPQISLPIPVSVHQLVSGRTYSGLHGDRARQMRTHVRVFIAWFNNPLIMHKGVCVRWSVSSPHIACRFASLSFFVYIMCFVCATNAPELPVVFSGIISILTGNTALLIARQETKGKVSQMCERPARMTNKQTNKFK